jgi:hypothetical protein
MYADLETSPLCAFTPAIVHSPITHILHNTIGIIIFGSEQVQGRKGLGLRVAGFTRGGSEYGYLQFRVERTAYRCITGWCLFPRGIALELDCTHVVDRDWRVWLIYLEE